MSTNGSPLNTVNMAPQGSLFRLQPRCEDNSGFSDNGLWTATGKYSRSGTDSNQYHPLYGDGDPPIQQPFPGAPQFYHHSPSNMTHNSSQPTTSISSWFPSYGLQWQEYDLHQGGYGKSKMFPPQHFPGQGPSSPGAPRVPPGLPGNNPVNQPTSSN